MIKARIVAIFMLAAFLVISAQSAASAEDTELLEIINDTGEPIWALYIVPVGRQDADWGNDLVGEGVMNQADRRIIYYDPAYRYYHIKFILDNKEEYILPNVDLLDAWRINIIYDEAEMAFNINKNSRG